MNFNLEQIRTSMLSLGFKFFEKGDYNLNIIAVRKNTDVSDNFDDRLFLAFKKNGIWQFKSYDFSTDPGQIALTNPSFEIAQKYGTAIMCEGQHLRKFQRGFHGLGAFRHRALRQIGEIPFYRDRNRNIKLDFDKNSITIGNYNCNIHCANNNIYANQQKVGRSSEGCQITRTVKDHSEFMDIVDLSVPIWGDIFSYTILKETQVLT